ncbi:hypothetical protein Mpt1_c02620 [Candidatus Methanoplasma termitum]|uniref:Restriction endonuclease type IV Mrr domain-containing protein n=1 Tax=Candidatus Methanoplasma termitum TaxID=1577791 RepID=A0A0A7LD04_9ARCH|nr:hypothetical protein [Candidatus Methanoplasma termitum]AIZ56162.1 hypothetical protein Mpt1_c02620 [Candidatus Methanoplasma termitum]
MFSEKDLFLFFSRSGFTAGMMKDAENNDRLTLVGLDDLFKF